MIVGSAGGANAPRLRPWRVIDVNVGRTRVFRIRRMLIAIVQYKRQDVRLLSGSGDKAIAVYRF